MGLLSPKGKWAVEVYMPSLAKDGTGAWAFQREEGNSQDSGKS